MPQPVQQFVDVIVYLVLEKLVVDQRPERAVLVVPVV
jgi:hypothetical protein